MKFSPILAIVLLLLFLFFLVSGNSFANFSSIQEQLKDIQVKIIKEKLKQLREQVLNIGGIKKEADIKPVVKPPEPSLSAEELSRRLETQIKVLGEVINALKPRAIEEETARLDRRLQEINQEIQAAGGERLKILQKELEIVFKDYAKLQEETRKAVEDSLKQKQLSVLQEQVLLLKEKVLRVPKPPVIKQEVALKPPLSTESEEKNKELQRLKEEIDKIKLKILQSQIQAIQSGINVILKGK